MVMPVSMTPMGTSAGASLRGAGSNAQVDAAGGPSGGTGGSFLDLLGQATSRLNGDLANADNAMASFAAGGSADLHTVVLQMQEASLGLKLGVQVRDRLLEAYQEVMRLQV